MVDFAKGNFFNIHLLCNSDASSACRFEKSVMVSQQFDIINRVAQYSRLSAYLADQTAAQPGSVHLGSLNLLVGTSFLFVSIISLINTSCSAGLIRSWACRALSNNNLWLDQNIFGIDISVSIPI